MLALCKHVAPANVSAEKLASRHRVEGTTNMLVHLTRQESVPPAVVWLGSTQKRQCVMPSHREPVMLVPQ